MQSWRPGLYSGSLSGRRFAEERAAPTTTRPRTCFERKEPWFGLTALDDDDDDDENLLSFFVFFENTRAINRAERAD